MRFKEVIEKSKKKATENDAGRKNIIGTGVWNRCSYVLTWLLLPTPLTPNMISFISLLCAVIGFIFMCLSERMDFKILGIVFFILWAILDCVDGNVARIKRQFSGVGDLWDAAAGYVAMSLMFLGIGICAFNPIDSHTIVYVILGALTSICSLLPRLLMHFKYHGEDNVINDKKSYGIIKLIAFNISSPDGFVLPFMLISILLHIENLYVTVYFVIYLSICIYTCAVLLKE